MYSSLCNSYIVCAVSAVGDSRVSQDSPRRSVDGPSWMDKYRSAHPRRFNMTRPATVFTAFRAAPSPPHACPLRSSRTGSGPPTLLDDVFPPSRLSPPSVPPSLFLPLRFGKYQRRSLYHRSVDVQLPPPQGELTVTFLHRALRSLHNRCCRLCDGSWIIL